MTANRVSRRDFLRLAGISGAVVATVGLAACAPATVAPAATEQEGAAAAPAATQVTLRKMAWGSPLEKENIESGLATFMAENPDIKVEYIHVPERYPEKLQTMLAAGDAPDVYKVGNYYPDIAVKGALLNITDQVTTDATMSDPDFFFPFEEKRSTVDGKWYAIGSTFQWRMLFYNTAALADAGIEPPSTDPAATWDWDTFLTNTTALTTDGKGNHPGDAGFDVQDVQQWGYFVPDYHYDNFVFSNGGKVIDETTLQYVLDQPEAVNAIQAFADLRLKNQVAAQGAMLQDMGMNAWQMLATGRIAIIQDGNWALQDIAKMDFDFGVGVQPMIKDPATVAASSWTGIYADTQYPEQSWRLLHYLNMDEYQAHLVRLGLWGVSHQTLLTPEGVKKWWNPDVHPENWLPLEADYKLNYGHVVPNVVGVLKAGEMLTQELSQVWTGEMTAEALLTDLVPRLNKTLEEEQAKV